MAQIDHSIYLQQQTPDIVGGIERGMNMRDMIDKRKKQAALDKKQKDIDDAYSAGVVTNPDGTTSVDRNKTLSGLAKVGGQEYLEGEQKFSAHDLAQTEAKTKKSLYEADTITRIAGSITDEPSYQFGIKEAAKAGIDVTQMPPSYDPKFINGVLARSLSYKEKIANQLEKDKIQNSALDRKEARDERRFQAGIKLDEKKQGLKTPFGYANTEDDAKKLKESFESKSTFDNKLEQMIALREKHKGGNFSNREDVARGKQLSKDLLLEYKNMAKLGVLSKNDEDIIRAIIPDDPLEYNSPLAAIQGQDPTLAKLKAFQADSNKDFQTRVNTRTRAGIDTAAQGAPRSQFSPGGNDQIAQQEQRAKQILEQRKKNKVAGK